MRAPPLLPTLSTMALALACAALIVAAGSASARAWAQAPQSVAHPPMNLTSDPTMTARQIDTVQKAPTQVLIGGLS